MEIKRSAEEMASEVKAEMKAGVSIGVPRTRWPDKAVVPSPLSMWRKRRCKPNPSPIIYCSSGQKALPLPVFWLGQRTSVFGHHIVKWKLCNDYVKIM